MSTDQRLRIKNVLLGVTATLDDGVTAAQILVMYRGGPENLRYLFEVNDYDAVITVDRPEMRESPPDRRTQSVPQRYLSDVRVDVTAVDKSTVTATKLLNKIRNSMETQIETNAEQATWTLIIRGSRPMNQVIGGFDPLWSDSYIIRYRPMSGST